MSAQSKTAAHLEAEAKTHVAKLLPENVAAAMRRGDALLVDIRESEERAEPGHVAGAIPVPRGMLEFAADPTSAWFRTEFDPGRGAIVFCATGARAALAADVLRQLGYADIACLDGGFAAWSAAGLATEIAAKQPPTAPDGDERGQP